MKYLTYSLAVLLFWTNLVLSHAQNSSKTNPLIGRWEVLQYAEQGLQVDKKQPAAPQALAVYRHVQKTRAKTWYGFDYDYADEYSRRRSREFQRWEERDSIQELKRITEAIHTPFFAVFFPDSTLALYNKDAATNQVSFPESRHYVFNPATMSMDVYPPGMLPPPGRVGGWVDRMDIQILFLSDTNMTLFIPEEGEIVTLVKTEYTIP
ncbi:MAG TPA: hypothetical protein DCF33_22100 [Saprospirales bacterium]|nr:hypothetical protein [Saprospirales bacterium]